MLIFATDASPNPDVYKKAGEAGISFLKSLVDIFGPVGTVFILFLCFFSWWGYKHYQNSRKDKETSETIKVLKEQIQSLSDDCRSHRMEVLITSRNFSFEQARILVIGGGKDARQTREILYGNDVSENGGTGLKEAKSIDQEKKSG